MNRLSSGLQDFYLDRPLNFAHRGASYEAPENTLAAFLLAIELGADGIEFDVQLSQDDQVVVIHDYELRKTTGAEGLVRDRTLDELKELDAGSHFDPAFADQRIPTLQEVIDTVGQRLLFNIELKSQRLGDDGLAAQVVRAVEDSHLLDRVIVSSFDPLAVRRVKQLNPWIPTGLLYAPDSPPLLRPWLGHLIHFDAMHPHYSTIDERYMRWARKRGYRVNVWTVDEPADMWQLMRWGVDTIITNRPDLLRQTLVAGRERWRAPGQELALLRSRRD
jgi:glycerophosphoryl diester phosphodiesterase